MGEIPSIKPRKLLKLLERKNFYITRQKGSHIILHKKDDSTKRVTLPLHNKDLKKKTLLSILKQAGLTINDITK